MIKFHKIRTAFIEDIELHSGVIAEIATASADIVPKILTDLRGKPLIGHPGAEIGTGAAIDGSPRKNRLAADAAFFDQLLLHHDSFFKVP